MSTENIVITKGDLVQLIKKRKLEEIKEGDSETDSALHIDTDEIIIEAEAEKFLTLFEKTFVGETEGTDSKDGPAANIAAKIVSKIKEKINGALGKNIPAKILKLILGIVEIVLKHGKGESDGAPETLGHESES